MNNAMIQHAIQYCLSDEWFDEEKDKHRRDKRDPFSMFEFS